MKCVSGVCCAVCGSTETKPNCWRYCCAALCSARVSTSVCVCDAASAVAVAFCFGWLCFLGESNGRVLPYTYVCGAVRFVYYDFIFTPHAGTSQAKKSYLCVCCNIQKRFYAHRTLYIIAELLAVLLLLLLLQFHADFSSLFHFFFSSTPRQKQ